MNRATRFRSFSPLSWPARKNHRKTRRGRGKSPLPLSSLLRGLRPLYEDSAYENDLEVLTPLPLRV